LGLFPVVSEIPENCTSKIPEHLWPEIIEQRKTKSLRQLAKDYGVSHEAVRRTLGRIGMFDLE
jgi:Zn-dependent peptidase ImmA (M78 family)